MFFSEFCFKHVYCSDALVRCSCLQLSESFFFCVCLFVMYLRMDAIPQFVALNDRRLALLGEMIDFKRSELERISHRHDETLSSMMSLYRSATANVISLRTEHRSLSCLASQLSREGAVRNAESESILNALHEMEEERKKLLNKIESPSWEIKHHFHILSFEHFRGNQQPHLLEIAGTFHAVVWCHGFK